MCAHVLLNSFITGINVSCSNGKPIAMSTYVKSKLSYPRPTDTCLECDGIVILCWGEKVRPYWRHKHENLDSSNCKSLGESQNHKFAKNMLTSFLNGGGCINVKKTCNNCHSERTELLNTEHQCTTEFSIHKDDVTEIFDIAEVANGQAIMGIEI